MAEGQKTLMRTGRRLVEDWGAGNRGRNTGRIKGGEKNKKAVFPNMKCQLGGEKVRFL